MLFWNTHRNADINSVICELIAENNISIVVLAEYVADIGELIGLLSIRHRIKMRAYNGCCERIKVIGMVKNVMPYFDNGNTTIQVIDNRDILCCVHLNSKIFSDHQGYREILIEQVIREIQRIEKDLGTENTIVVGDFNINPYDPSCMDARYFHGMPIYEESERKSRTIAGTEYSMFYNPMWRLLGDEKKPYGTYYHSGNDTINTYWNIYDQVIIRPAVRKRFVDESLKIVTETQTRYLLNTKGHPDENISDHLPIIFEIREEDCCNGKEA